MASRSKAKGILPVLRTDSPDFEKEFEHLVDRRHSDVDDVEKVVRKIVERVRDGGDDELLALVRKHDHSKIAKIEQLEVTNEEMEEAGELIDPADRAALGKSAMRVREFHRKRIPSSWEVREEGGGTFGHRVRPLERVGMTHRKRHLPAQLSGGEMQLVSIARALVRGPRLILADEPTGNVNVATGKRIMALLTEVLKEAESAMVLVTHNPEDAAYSDRVVFLQDGRIDPNVSLDGDDVTVAAIHDRLRELGI